MWLWNEWFDPNSFYSYCAAVPLISGAIVYSNIKLKKPLKAMIFPALFLVFMFPLPESITGPLSHQLKYLSASMAAAVLNLMQIHSSVQQGNMIVMPRGIVVVNDACSGIRAIISLAAMGSVFAYYMESSLNKKFLLMMLVIPVALLTNAVRIVFLALITQFFGARFIAGFVHNFAGFLIYGVSFAVFFQVSRSLSQKVPAAA